jgi:hypothetical protein
MKRYRRADLGEGLFFHIAVDDPFGPRFEHAQVARADLLVYRLVESEQLHGETAEWQLYAGDTLLAERTFGPRAGDARP